MFRYVLIFFSLSILQIVSLKSMGLFYRQKISGSESGRTRLADSEVDEQDTRNEKYLLSSLKIKFANQPHCLSAGVAEVFPSVNSACARTLFLSVSCLLISPYAADD